MPLIEVMPDSALSSDLSLSRSLISARRFLIRVTLARLSTLEEVGDDKDRQNDFDDDEKLTSL